MCGRFSQQRPTSEIAQIFEADDLAGDPGEHFNVAPTDEAAVVVQRDERRAVVRYRWGLVPSWADPGRASRAFNARAETLATSGLFRDAYRRRRCLVPVDGFYEWLRDGSRRQPMRIHDPDDRPLALAGLWTGRKDEETGEWLRTFTIVTTRPNGFMASIHDRMPVVVPPASWATWLDPTPATRASCGRSSSPRDDVDLAAYPVSTLVNNVRNDGPELILPLHSAPDGLPDRPTSLLSPSDALRRLPAHGPGRGAEGGRRILACIHGGGIGAHDGREGRIGEIVRGRQHHSICREPVRERPVGRDEDHEMGSAERSPIHARGKNVCRGIVGHDQDAERREIRESQGDVGRLEARSPRDGRADGFRRIREEVSGIRIRRRCHERG